MPPSVDVGHVEDGHRSFDRIRDFQHLIQRAPEFLSTRGLHPDERGLLRLQPWEDRIEVLIIVPDLMDAVDHA